MREIAVVLFGRKGMVVIQIVMANLALTLKALQYSSWTLI